MQLFVHDIRYDGTPERYTPGIFLYKIKLPRKSVRSSFLALKFNGASSFIDNTCCRVLFEFTISRSARKASFGLHWFSLICRIFYLRALIRIRNLTSGNKKHILTRF